MNSSKSYQSCLIVLSALMVCVGVSVNAAELVGYWPMDEGQGAVVKNAAGGVDGQIVGAGWVDGKRGKALSFDGKRSYVEIKDTGRFTLQTMSLEAWICPRSFPRIPPVGWGGIVGKAYATESTYGMRLGSTRRAHFRVYGPFGKDGALGSFDYGYANRKLELNRWYHLVATYDATQVCFYINGRLDAAYKETRRPGANSQNVYIGSVSANGRFFDGVIDEVKIYKGALRDDEIEAVYRQSGGTDQVYSVKLPDVQTPPQIDGRLDDACWAGAAKVGLVDMRNGKVPKTPTDAYITCDSNALYIGFVCHEPQTGKLRAETAERDGKIWQDDCVEVFVDPGRSLKNYYQFLVNSKGVQADGKYAGNMTGEKIAAWDGQWESKASAGKNEWSVEMALPWYNFPFEGDGGTAWGINLCRERKVEPELSQWSPTGSGFHDPKLFGVVRNAALDSVAPKVEITAPELLYELGSSGAIEIVLQQQVVNRSKDVRRLTVNTAKANGAWRNTEQVEIAGGESKLLRIPLRDVKGSEEGYRIRQEIREGTAERPVFFAIRSVVASHLIKAWLDRSYYRREEGDRQGAGEYGGHVAVGY